jgi:hypothetical protein
MDLFTVKGEKRMNYEVIAGLCKLFFTMICFWVGLAILLTIPVAIYYLIQEKKKEIEE